MLILLHLRAVVKLFLDRYGEYSQFVSLVQRMLVVMSVSMPAEEQEGFFPQSFVVLS
jgi:hypothetical protein